ncbi:MAG: hypothetical protein WC325_08620 [Candidatus Bathyarchaeia archaeon]
MKFKLSVFFVITLFSLAAGVLKDNATEYLLQQSVTYGKWGTIGDYVSTFYGLAILFVSPILVCAFFYLIGKRIDLESQFLSVVFPLFIGSWLGHTVAYVFMRIMYSGLPVDQLINSNDYLNAVVQILFYNTLSIEFFAALSAFCVAYFLNKPKNTQTTQ